VKRRPPAWASVRSEIAGRHLGGDGDLRRGVRPLPAPRPGGPPEALSENRRPAGRRLGAQGLAADVLSTMDLLKIGFNFRPAYPRCSCATWCSGPSARASWSAHGVARGDRLRRRTAAAGGCGVRPDDLGGGGTWGLSGRGWPPVKAVPPASPAAATSTPPQPAHPDRARRGQATNPGRPDLVAASPAAERGRRRRRPRIGDVAEVVRRGPGR